MRECGSQTVHRTSIGESRPRQPWEGAGGPTVVTLIQPPWLSKDWGPPHRNESGELDVTPLIKFAEEREEEAKRRDDVYRYYPLSIASYARLTQRDIVDSVSRLSAANLPIRCCLGNSQEFETASAPLATPARIVVDTTALATIFHTKSYKYLSKLQHHLIVPHSALIELQLKLDNLRPFGEDEDEVKISNEPTALSVIQELPASTFESWDDQLLDFIESIKAHTTIVDGLPLASMESEKREQLSSLFGRSVAEAIASAEATHAILWTDDLFVSQLAMSECKVRRVWTEVLFTASAVSNDLFTEDDLYSLIKSLLHLGYRHCRLNPTAAERIAEECTWDARSEPMVSVVDWMSISNIKQRGVLDIAERLLPRVYFGADNLIGNMTVLSILKAVGSRPDGLTLISELRRRVGIICRGNFLAEQRLTQDIDVWLATNTRISLPDQDDSSV